MSENTFQVGDKVEAFGVQGTVTCADENSVLVRAVFRGNELLFFHDGKYEDWHKEPSLKLIKRPKKKVTKTMYQAICHYENSCGHYIPDEIFEDAEHAREVVGMGFICLGPAITFEFEE